jgi:outer membrane lipoprotein carrier protein
VQGTSQQGIVMRMCVRSPLIMALGLVASTASAASPPVKEVVAKMQAFYLKTKDLKGNFKQVYTDTLYNRERTSYGYLYVRKPGMMRWNYVKPEKKSFIADGKELWVHEPEDKQAFRNPLSTNNLSTGLTFLFGTGDLQKEFNITVAKEKLGAPGDVVLMLAPKVATAQYTHILLAVRPGSDFTVGESMVVGKTNRNHFIFTHLEFNTKLPKSRFQFRPSADTRVINGATLNRP